MSDLKSALVEKLGAIVGADNVFGDDATLVKYSKDQSFVPARKPHVVAKPKNADEIAAIIKLANESNIGVVPFSTGTTFAGAAIPDAGGILMDLSRMNRILEIDPVHWNASIEPGVTFAQLNAELKKHGLRALVPLAAPPSASVLATYAEREPVPQSADFVFGNEILNDFKTILPTGVPFTIGNIVIPGAVHAHPGGPGLNFYRLFIAAQGTMGVIYEMNTRLVPIPKEWKILFASFDSIETLQKAVKGIQRKELGLEVFALNNFDMATLMVDEDPADTKALKAGAYIGANGAKPWSSAQKSRFETLRQALPAWTLIVSVPAWVRRNTEKVAWQVNDLKDLAAEDGYMYQNTVAGFVGLDKLVMDELTTPWRMQKKFGFKGSCHGLQFMAKGNNIKPIEDAIKKIGAKYRYNADQIGAYVAPVERARSFYCIYDLHCDPTNAEETARVKSFFNEVSDAIIDLGAYFDRPYGPWAEMMYRRNAVYAESLKKIKKDMDPNGIMNPGKLCF